MSETALVRACLQLLAVRGIFAWRNHSGGIKIGERFLHIGVKGGADIIGILPGGRLLAVECKRPGNRLTVDQHKFKAEIQERGGLALVVYSAEQLEKELTALLSPREGR